MIWWPFATKPERADTSEVTDLHSDAPPLYSTVRPNCRVNSPIARGIVLNHLNDFNF